MQGYARLYIFVCTIFNASVYFHLLSLAILLRSAAAIVCSIAFLCPLSAGYLLHAKRRKRGQEVKQELSPSNSLCFVGFSNDCCKYKTVDQGSLMSS